MRIVCETSESGAHFHLKQLFYKKKKKKIFYSAKIHSQCYEQYKNGHINFHPLYPTVDALFVFLGIV